MKKVTLKRHFEYMNKDIINESEKFKDLRFDWYSLLHATWFKELENEVIQNINSKRSKRGLSGDRKAERDKNERLVFNQILSALYQSYFTVPFGAKTVSIQLKENEYTGSRFSYSAVREVFIELKVLHLIKVIDGIQGKHITRILPSQRLEVLFDSIGLRWAKQQPNPLEQLIVLREQKHPNSPNPKLRKKKLDVEVPETKQVIELRQNLYIINETITEHCISLDLSDSQLLQSSSIIAKRKKDKEGNDIDDENSARGINFHNIQLRRILSRGLFSKGGRFYGGWWQGIPGIYRQHILIDGYKVAEVDYSTISLRIIYAQLGINVPLDQDLYHIGLDDWSGKADPRRDVIKTYINAALNDELGYFKLSPDEQACIGISHEQLKALVAKSHEPISDSFNSGVGLYTQYIDSQIAEQVMLRMADEGHVVLPIHDSFIVRLGYEYRLREIMLEVFSNIVGAEGKVSADYPRLREHFGLSDQAVAADAAKEHVGIVSGSELYDEIFEESIMKNFSSSFRGSI